jgi:hypothetical protein
MDSKPVFKLEAFAPSFKKLKKWSEDRRKE